MIFYLIYGLKYSCPVKILTNKFVVHFFNRWFISCTAAGLCAVSINSPSPARAGLPGCRHSIQIQEDLPREYPKESPMDLWTCGMST
jgi:hypothetical protein